MAHLSNDSLPESFDVIVDGTGFTLSLLAGALARSGRAVLHIDRNCYYGECWATFMHRHFEEWIRQRGTISEDYDIPKGPIPADLGEGKVALVVKDVPGCVSNILELVPQITKVSSNLSNQAAAVLTGQPPPVDQPTSEKPTISETTASETTALEKLAAEDKPTSSDQSSSTVQSSSADQPTSEKAASEGKLTPAVRSPSQNEPSAMVGPTRTDKPTQPTSANVTWDMSEKRWLNYDIMPKVLHCQGPLVNILTETNVGRYLEFRAIDKLFGYAGGKIEQVPCSREDVFSSKIITMVEKRKLMKFLTFCSEYEKHPDEYSEFSHIPYVEFLKRKELTPSLVQYVVHSIALGDESMNTLMGLKSTQIFIKSLGRFGNAPFLFPLYGCSELPQALCRFSAVWGSVYCLTRWVQALVTEENKLVGVVCSSGQKISCKAVVTSGSLMRATMDMQQCIRVTKLSRAIFVTDGPIGATDGGITIVSIPPLALGPSQGKSFHLLQLDSSSSCTPAGSYMVHITAPSIESTAEKDLSIVAKSLFNIEGQEDSNKSGPRLLYAVYFNIDTYAVDQSQVPSQVVVPQNLYMVSDPDGSITFEAAVEEAKQVFQKLCPGEAFMPATPNPEDIVYDNSSTADDSAATSVEGSASQSGDPAAVNKEPETANQSGTEVQPNEQADTELSTQTK